MATPLTFNPTELEAIFRWKLGQTQGPNLLEEGLFARPYHLTPDEIEKRVAILMQTDDRQERASVIVAKMPPQVIQGIIPDRAAEIEAANKQAQTLQQDTARAASMGITDWKPPTTAMPANSDVFRAPTVSIDQISAELKGSPLAPYAQEIYDLGSKYGVDPAVFLGVVKGENDYGRAPNSLARTNYNWASISNAAYGGEAVKDSRWGQYPTPQAGIEAFYKLLTTEYLPQGQTTLDSIWWGKGGSPTVTGQHAYAPAFENSPTSLANVRATMARMSGSLAGTTAPAKGYAAKPEDVRPGYEQYGGEPSRTTGVVPPAGLSAAGVLTYGPPPVPPPKTLAEAKAELLRLRQQADEMLTSGTALVPNEMKPGELIASPEYEALTRRMNLLNGALPLFAGGEDEKMTPYERASLAQSKEQFNLTWQRLVDAENRKYTDLTASERATAENARITEARLAAAQSWKEKQDVLNRADKLEAERNRIKEALANLGVSAIGTVGNLGMRATEAYANAAPNMIPPGQEYYFGREPGGPMEQIYKMGGSTFTPQKAVGTQVNFGAPVQNAANALSAFLQQAVGGMESGPAQSAPASAPSPIANALLAGGK